jgi:hypothetical protein
MNSNRSSRKFGFFRKKGNVDLLPTKPVDNVVIQPWWIIQVRNQGNVFQWGSWNMGLSFLSLSD